MATAYTSLLGFALPVTGELAGTWGTVVNDSITELVEDSIAGTATASVASGDWTLSTTGSGAANEARCAILIPTGSPGVSRNIIAPSQSKAYVVINQSDAAVVVKGSATTGTTIPAGAKAVVAWNGSDFVTVATQGGTIEATQVDITAQGDLRLQDAAGGQYAAIQAPATISSSYTLTLPTTDGDAGQFLQTDGSGVLTWAAGAAGDVTAAGNNAFTGANTFYNSTGQTFGTGTSTQDGIIVAGRAGGSSSYRVTLTPGTLSASRTVTLPDANTTLPIATQPITFSGPSAARTYTFPDASATVLTTNAAVTVTQGGTGATSLTSNNVILGNGASAVQFVAPGANGNVLTSDGTTWTSAAPSGGSSDFQEFTSSGTWTKPSGATFVMAEVLSGGGGGGSGQRNVSQMGGGRGGGGGAYAYRLFKASDLASTISVTVGAGGSGGAAQTVDGTAGNAGTAGGASSFGSLLTAGGGSGGNGGASTGSNQNAVSGGSVLVGAGIAAISEFGAGGTNNQIALPSGFGGGAGGGIDTLGEGQDGASSYQGGAGAGAGGGVSSTNLTSIAGDGGGFTETRGTGALGGVHPGTSGASGSGRLAGGGGACGWKAYSIIAGQTMCYGNSTFAATDTLGSILTSANGTDNWVYRQGPDSGRKFVGFILHDGTKFVLCNASGTSVWTTTDFSTYTEVAGLSSTVAITRFKYVNGKYFILGTSGRIRVSDNLTSWSDVTSPSTNTMNDICWTGTNYVLATQATGGLRYSSDLSSWSTPTGTAGIPYSCESDGAGNVVAQTATTPFAQISTNNGTSFAGVATTLVTAAASRAIAYLNSTWFLSAANSLYTSSDGNSWSVRVSATGDNLGGGFAYDGTTYVVGSSSTTTDAAKTAVPADLNTWTARAITASNGAGGSGGNGGVASGGGGGGGSYDGSNSGAGGNGGNGLVRVYTW